MATEVTRMAAIQHLREHFGLTMAEAMKLLNTPTHPHHLRDDFARAALQGVTSNPESGCNSPGDLAHWAYQCADAMLKERVKYGE